MRRRNRLLLLLLLLAFALSLGFSLARQPSDTALLTHDAAGYSKMAVRVLSEGNFGGNTFLAPAYPTFLAAIYAVAGEELKAVYVVQSLLLVIALFFLYKLAFYITENEHTSLLAVALCLLWPPVWLMAGHVMTEILAAAVIAPSVWYVTLAVEKPSLGRCITAGVLIGIGALTKAVVLPFALVAALVIVLSGRSDRLKRVGWGALVMAVCALVVAPWSIRNYRITHAFVPVCTGGGYNFWLGNWPPMHTSRWEWNKFPPPLDTMLKGKSQVEIDRILMHDAMRYIKEDPVRAAGLCLRKFSSLWLGSFGADPRSSGNPIPHIGRFGIPKRSFFYLPLFVAAVWGWMVLTKPARARARVMMALLVMWTLIYSAIDAVPRYASPVALYEILLVAVAVRSVTRRDKLVHGGETRSV